MAVGLLLAAIVIIGWKVGLPRWRRRAAAGAVEADPTVDATDYRARAEAEAEVGDWHGALRDRFRALVRELETRTILDVRPARTALETAAGAGSHLPELVGQLWPARRSSMRSSTGTGSPTRPPIDEWSSWTSGRALRRTRSIWRRRPHGGRPVSRPGWLERSRIMWLGGVLLVGVLIVVTIGGFRYAVSVQRPDDPRSTTGNGVRALAQLLEDEGVRVEVTDRVDDAISSSDASTLLVVASPDRLSGEQAARLGGATYGRLLLLRASGTGLRAFGVPAESTPRPTGTVDPGCSEQAAVRAGPVDADDFAAGYVSTEGAVTLRCYPSDEGAAWLRVGGPFGPVDLVAGGVGNDVLAHDGNAAFGMNVFGSHPRIVWLMGQRAAAAAEGGEVGPTLLPRWWAPAIVQAFIAVIVVGIWRGRRLGPILREPLPVKVRASETVEGHGRMYARIGARDRAAEALRRGACGRLGRTYGHPGAASGVASAEDLVALSAAIAARTGRAAPEIRQLLAGPPPPSDDELLTLAQHLDRLEQEARQL